MVKWLSKLWGKFAAGIYEVSFVMLIWGRIPLDLGILKLGIGVWESGVLWEILLGFKVIFDFIKFLS
jgi:hypothetical protein